MCQSVIYALQAVKSFWTKIFAYCQRYNYEYTIAFSLAKLRLTTGNIFLAPYGANGIRRGLYRPR